MKKKIYSHLQAFSKALIIPVRLLPMVGLLLALTNLFTHPMVMALLPEDSSLIQFFTILSTALVGFIQHFGLFFTIGIASGLANNHKVEAGFIGTLAYFTSLFVSGSSQAMGVGQAILLGVLTAYLHNHFAEVKFYSFFQIYGGTRFTVLLMIPLTILFTLVFNWVTPFVQSGLLALSGWLPNLGNIGLFLYGTLERLSIPSGLQHLVTTPLLYTSMGGTEEVGGVIYEGARNIYYAEMVDPTVTVLSKNVLWDARGIPKMFGLVGASLAMYHTAKPEQKKKAKSALIPGALTSFMVGVTEPIEFLFLFVSPKLYVAHAALSGLSMVTLSLLDVRTIGPTGFIDFLLYNLPLGVTKTRWPLFILVGLFFFLIYYLVFRLVISKDDLQVLGRTEPSDEMTEIEELETRIVPTIVEALGGAENIQTLTNCYSRLRLTVNRPELVKASVLKNDTGASGVMINEKNVHVVYGLEVNKIRRAIDNYLARNSKED